MQHAAMKASQHVWVDGSLRNGEWLAGELEKLRDMYPLYRIALFYIYASKEKVFERMKHRAAMTGREVPEEMVLQSLQAPDHSLRLLTPQVRPVR